MNIFGIGGWELVLILLIGLVIAGPKRMIQWAYLLGRFTARLRDMWAEMMVVVQKELDDSGVDVKLPKELPTRQNIARSFNSAIKPIREPLEQTASELNSDLRVLKETSRLAQTGTTPARSNGHAARPADDTAAPKDFGTWSSAGADLPPEDKS
jgi:Sec-independent protein translocase protein TatA